MIAAVCSGLKPNTFVKYTHIASCRSPRLELLNSFAFAIGLEVGVGVNEGDGDDVGRGEGWDDGVGGPTKSEPDAGDGVAVDPSEHPANSPPSRIPNSIGMNI